MKKNVMKVVAGLLLALLLVTVPLLTACPAGVPEEVVEVTWGASGTTGSNVQCQMAIEVMVNKYSEWVRISRMSMGSAAMPGMVQRGELDIAFVGSSSAEDMLTGTGLFEELPAFPEVRILWMQAPMFLRIFVLKDSPIKTWDDLRGKTVNMPRATSSTFPGQHSVWEESGFYDEFNFLPSRSPTRLDSEDLRSGKFDALLASGGLATSHHHELAMTPGIRLIEIPSEVQDRILARFPGGAVRTAIPLGTYEGQNMIYPTVGTFTTYFTTEEALSEAVVYEICKAFFDHLEEAVPLTTAMLDYQKPWLLLAQTWAPRHPGAEKYFKEVGWL